MKFSKSFSTLFVVSLLLSLTISVSAQDYLATVVIPTLNFRDEPSLSGAILTSLHDGDAYPVVARTVSGHWYQLDVNGDLGWSCAHFLELDSDPHKIPVDEGVVNEDCQGNVVALWSSSNPFTVERVSDHVRVTENLTGRSFTTHAQYSSPNDVKDWGFSEDNTRFAAAYHYGHDGGYTWRGVWSTANDYTFGYFLYSDIVWGEWTGIQGVFD